MCSRTAQAFAVFYSEKMKWENSSLVLGRKFWVREKLLRCVQVQRGGNAVLGVGGSWPTTATASPIPMFRGDAGCRNCRTGGRELPSSDRCNGCCASFQPLPCCQEGETSLQAGVAPAPMCCPASWGWTSAWAGGFSWLCGSGIQELPFSLNDVKLPMKVCCF